MIIHQQHHAKFIQLAQVVSQESRNQTEAYSSPKLKTNCAGAPQ
jgi:hypothetical protein